MTPFVVAGKYHVVSLLGTGGMGAVYDAIHQTTGRRVALKLLRDERVPSPDARERFLREARVVGGLSSPFIAEVLDAGTDEGGTPYLAMEFIDGRDLSVVLAEAGRLDVVRAVRIAREVCQGLAIAHEAGIVHRDVKPANVRLEERPSGTTTKLLDFGIAKDLSDELGLTASGDIIGSPLYMAPEQFGLGSVDARTDVWGVGLLLFESLTGEKLHPDATTVGLRAACVPRDPAPDVRLRTPSVPESLANVVARALSIDPSRRYADARAMDAALANALLEDPSETVTDFSAPPAFARAPNRRWLGVVIGTALLGVVGLATLVFLSHPTNAPTTDPEAISSPPPESSPPAAPAVNPVVTATAIASPTPSVSTLPAPSALYPVGASSGRAISPKRGSRERM